MAFRRVMALTELWQGEMVAHVVDGKKVLLVRVGEGSGPGVHAFEDRCAHMGVALSQGNLDGTTITCSAHHYQYDARTGQGVNPKNLCLVAFACKVEDGDILVDVSQATRAGTLVPLTDRGPAT
jgi:toluene monooxygenase system ferredoxin subunit